MSKKKMTEEEREAARERFVQACEGLAERSRERQRGLIIKIEELKQQISDKLQQEPSEK